MNYIILEDAQMSSIKAGEAITLSAVMAILAAAIVAVVVYKLFMSNEGTTTLPGGFKFTWDD